MMTPTQDYRRTSYQRPAPMLKGIDARVNTVIGAYHRRSRILGELRRQAAQIDLRASQYVDLPSPKFQEALMGFREQFRRSGKLSDEVLITALAAIREAAFRQLGLRPFPVQLMGALAMHRGYLAEMATGEGKTLTAGIAGVLSGWTGRPCHVLTVNDYLVQRDADWLRPLYSFCGVRVGAVTGGMQPLERQKGYACDITYTTSKELLADFLRDRLKLGELRHPTRRLIRQMLSPRVAQDGLVLRGLHTTIVDEADSILIDEAVTPLIISTTHKNDSLREAAEMAEQIASELQPESDYRMDRQFKEIEFTGAGLEKLAGRCAALPGLWKGPDRRVELIRQSLVAREFFLRDKQYIVEGDKVVIVDEFTGRPMPQRTWREGMHQAIEAKEGLPISDPSETVARLSFQRFFRCFYRLSGMSGTAKEAAGELWHAYKLPVITIPTNKPCIREHWPDRVFATEDAKWAAITEEVVQFHATGRPILVGTRSVAASERLGKCLEERGLEIKLLNAVRLREEAEIVAFAGERGRITISTNMAGRGTDIKLGQGVAPLGGLHVIATERHESGRVDRQLFGRSARQGDAGSAQAFVSAEDELIRRYATRPVAELLQRSVERNLPGKNMIAKTAFRLAQRKAQQLAAKQRAGVLRADTWLDEALSFAGSEGV